MGIEGPGLGNWRFLDLGIEEITGLDIREVPDLGIVGVPDLGIGRNPKPGNWGIPDSGTGGTPGMGPGLGIADPSPGIGDPRLGCPGFGNGGRKFPGKAPGPTSARPPLSGGADPGDLQDPLPAPGADPGEFRDPFPAPEELQNPFPAPREFPAPFPGADPGEFQTPFPAFSGRYRAQRSNSARAQSPPLPVSRITTPYMEMGGERAWSINSG